MNSSVVSSISSGSSNPSIWAACCRRGRRETACQTVCRLELPVDQPLSGVAGEIVLMVEGRGAAMLDQLGHGRQRRMIEALLRQPREDRIDPVEPLDHRQFGPVEIGAVAHEALEEMVMGVDEARIDKPARRIADLGALRQRGIGEPWANRPDRRAVGQQIDVTEHDGARAIIGDDRRAGFEED